MTENTKQQHNPMSIIFISHASEDKHIVENFINYILNLGLGIRTRDIFCSSTAGTKPRTGEKWLNVIKDHLLNAEVVFLFITTNYKSSEICLNEAGAAWVLSKKIVPLILEPIDYNRVGIVFEEYQVEKLDKSESLDRIKDELERILKSGPGISLDRWTRLKDDYLSFLKNYLEEYPFKTRQEEFHRIENEIQLLKEKNKRLEVSCKIRLIGMGILVLLFLVSLFMGQFRLTSNNHSQSFSSLETRVKYSQNEIISVNEVFDYSSDMKYWLCFINDENIWPKLEITGSEIRKSVALPGTGFHGGMLVLAEVPGEISDRFNNWLSRGSQNPLKRPKELNVIMETKITIEVK